MTYEEAIKELEQIPKHIGGDCDGYEKRAIRMAIKALEKQMPKKPSGSFDDEIYGKTYVCECTGIINEYQKFCPNCGQFIDWSDAE